MKQMKKIRLIGIILVMIPIGSFIHQLIVRNGLLIFIVPWKSFSPAVEGALIFEYVIFFIGLMILLLVKRDE